MIAPGRVRRLLVAALVTVASLAFAVDAQAAWAPQTSNTASNLYGVSAIDANHAWAVGANGAIVATTNGGATWTGQTSNTTQPLTSVSFVDANHGWAVGYGGTILVTTNGGGTWTPQTSGISIPLLGVKFVDLNDGWAVGYNGTILVTTNGGGTWTPQTSGVTHYVAGISAVDANHAWAVGEHDFAVNGPALLATTDGGMIWSQQTSNASSSDDLQAVSFLDANHGWAVGDTGGSALILGTTDGGTTWTPQAANDSGQILYGVAGVDASHAWAVGTGGIIVGTTDGATWAQQFSNSTYDFTGVAFADVNHGWAIGLGGKILAYTASSTVTNPTVSLTTPANGAHYAGGSVVHASYSCTAAAGTTISSCSGPVANGAAIDTSTPGSHTFTVHAIDANGGTATVSATYTVTTLSGQGPPIGVRLSTNFFAEGAALPSLTGGLPGNPIRVLPGNPIRILPGNPIKIATAGALAATASAHKRVGTKFKFRLSEAATVRVLFTHAASGRKQGKRCVRQTASNRRRPKCSGNVLVGGLRFAAPAGSPVLHFAGRLSRSKALKPGAYTAVIFAIYANGSTSAPKALHFKIVKR